MWYINFKNMHVAVNLNTSSLWQKTENLNALLENGIIEGMMMIIYHNVGWEPEGH